MDGVEQKSGIKKERNGFNDVIGQQMISDQLAGVAESHR